MLKIKAICPGACGGKSGIELVKAGVLDKEDILLLNTTLKDIPFEYKKEAVIFGHVPGCGKERSVGYTEAYDSIQDNELSIIDDFITPDTDIVIINPSTEGGTGSGSSIIFAQYVKEVFDIPVILFPFTGFEDDLKGMQNTIEFFKDLGDAYGISIIPNKLFLVDGNKLKAEKAANDEFVKRVRILSGMEINEAVQNIDKTDLTKVVATPGNIIAERIILDKCKSVDQINKAIINALDNLKCLDISEKGYERLAVVCSVKEDTKNNIDYTFSVIEDRLGTSFETFTHIQDNIDNIETIDIIATGLKMPMDEIIEIYDKFKEKSEKLNNKEDTFFDKLSALDTTSTIKKPTMNIKPRKQQETDIKDRKASFFCNKQEANKDDQLKKREAAKEKFMKNNY